jgi:hypothetical protein
MMFDDMNANTSNVSHAGANAAALTTTAGLAARYAISPRQVQKFVESGVFPTVRMGRRCLRFDVAECDAALDRFKVRAAATGRAARKAAVTDERRA